MEWEEVSVKVEVGGGEEEEDMAEEEDPFAINPKHRDKQHDKNNEDNENRPLSIVIVSCLFCGGRSVPSSSSAKRLRDEEVGYSLCKLLSLSNSSYWTHFATGPYCPSCQGCVRRVKEGLRKLEGIQRELEGMKGEVRKKIREGVRRTMENEGEVQEEIRKSLAHDLDLHQDNFVQSESEDRIKTEARDGDGDPLQLSESESEEECDSDPQSFLHLDWENEGEGLLENSGSSSVKLRSLTRSRRQVSDAMSGRTKTGTGQSVDTSDENEDRLPRKRNAIRTRTNPGNDNKRAWGFDIPVEIIESKKGKPMVVLEGHIFWCHKTKTAVDNRQWKCCKHQSLKCPVRLHTTDTLTSPKLLKIMGTHNHQPDPSKVELKKGLKRLKDEARCSTAPPTEIFGSIPEIFSSLDKEYIPRRDVLKKIIQSARPKDNSYSTDVLSKMTHNDKGEKQPISILEFSDMPPAEIVSSKKGKPMVVYEGCLFWLQAVGTGKKIWKCSNVCSKPKCLARLYTTDSPTDPRIIKMIGTHNHEPNPTKIERIRSITVLKEEARFSTSSPSEIIANASRTIVSEDCLPRHDSLTRTLQRLRDDGTDGRSRNNDVAKRKRNNYPPSVSVKQFCDSPSVTVVLSGKGKPMISHEGYLFWFKMTGLAKNIWRCSKHASKCPVILHTTDDPIDPRLLKMVGTHNHDPNPPKAEKKKRKKEAKM